MPESTTPFANGGEVGYHEQLRADDGLAQSESGSAIHRSVKKNGDNVPPNFHHAGRMLHKAPQAAAKFVSHGLRPKEGQENTDNFNT